VLRDPRQKRFFKARDIHDLFTLGSQVRNFITNPFHLSALCVRLVPPVRF